MDTKDSPLDMLSKGQLISIIEGQIGQIEKERAGSAEQAAEITRLRAALDAMTAERDAARAKALEDAAAKCLTHPMRFAGQMEDHVRTTLALAISAMKEPTK